MVIARLVSALLMSFIIGVVMFYTFHQEEKNRVSTIQTRGGPLMSGRGIILLLLIVAWLLAPNYLISQGPYWQKVIVWAIGLIIAAIYAWIFIDRDNIKDWLKETWWFVRIIFPLLLVGVFVVGIIGAILPADWVQKIVGGEGFRQSFIATLFGSLTYFATLTEGPFVHTMLNLGMGKGAALALLLTGPGLSLPNWIAIARVFGKKKALVYVVTIIILGTLAGWIAGFILR